MRKYHCKIKDFKPDEDASGATATIRLISYTWAADYINGRPILKLIDKPKDRSPRKKTLSCAEKAYQDLVHSETSQEWRDQNKALYSQDCKP